MLELIGNAVVNMLDLSTILGMVAGLAVSGALKERKLTYGRALMGAVAGCVAYYILYFAKTFFYDGLLVDRL